MVHLVSLLGALGLALSAAAQLSITQPTTAHYWVGNSTNTLAWTGTSPATFSVFIANPDVKLLTSMLALTSVTPAYQTSLTITPTLPAGDGYTIMLTNPLNSSDVYATSQSFRIVPQGSTYPTDSASASGSATASGSASAGSGSASGSASASGASASASSTGGAGRQVTAGGAGVLAAALGVVALL